MQALTHEEYRDRGVKTPVGNGVFSLLTPAELAEVKLCVIQSYAGRHNTREFIKRSYERFAAQPVAAVKFCAAIEGRFK